MTAAELLRVQLDAGKTLSQIALEIGYSRTAVSLYRSGRYQADPALIEAALRKAYDRCDCPHLGEPVEPAVCQRKALAPKPFGGSARLAWWTACQRCPHRPDPHQPDPTDKE
jgi:transcriptional regulator with XRE-family HTH domain